MRFHFPSRLSETKGAASALELPLENVALKEQIPAPSTKVPGLEAAAFLPTGTLDFTGGAAWVLTKKNGAVPAKTPKTSTERRKVEENMKQFRKSVENVKQVGYTMSESRAQRNILGAGRLFAGFGENTMFFRHSCFALPALLAVGLLCAPVRPAHAGFLDKIKNKIDKVTDKADEANAKIEEKTSDATSKVTKPLDEAQQKVMAPVNEAQRAAQDAQNRAMAPVNNARNAMTDAQNRAMAPVNNARNSVANAQNKVMAPVNNARATANAIRLMPAQMTNALRFTDGAFQKDAILRSYNLDALASADGQKLRLVGTVQNAAQRARAQQIAARNFPGGIVNQIRVVPAMAKGNLRGTIRKLGTPIKR